MGYVCHQDLRLPGLILQGLRDTEEKPTNRTYVFRDENSYDLENHARRSHGYR